MAVHAKDTLGSASISQILNLSFAIPALEAICAKCLVACEDSKILDLVPTATAAVGAVVADKGSVTQKKKIRV